MVGSADELVAHAQSRVGLTLRGKYRIERVLGVGGMAAVYEATHRNGHRVAIKMLHSMYSVRADIRTRFVREGHAANAVDHPGAVDVIDDDITEDGSAYLVMELLDGESVEDLWARNRRRLPPQLVLALAYELCDVLDVAHRAGIVHRDIKPENLFLTHDGQLKVLDFGLAQLRDIGPKVTTTGMVFGTPAFMAPEQARGRTSQVDAQSDVWAVGATMFTLLSGVTVHSGETGQHMIVLAATKQARSLTSVLPTAAPELAELVDRALTFDKERRWPSAGAMRAAVRQMNIAVFGAAPDLRALTSDDETRVQLAPVDDYVRMVRGETVFDHDGVPVRRAHGLPNLAVHEEAAISSRRADSTSSDAITAPKPVAGFTGHAELPPPIHRSLAIDEDLEVPTLLRQAYEPHGAIASLDSGSDAPTLSRRAAARLVAITRLLRRIDVFDDLVDRLRGAGKIVRTHGRHALLVLVDRLRDAGSVVRTQRSHALIALVSIAATLLVIFSIALLRARDASETSASVREPSLPTSSSSIVATTALPSAAVPPTDAPPVATDIAAPTGSAPPTVVGEAQPDDRRSSEPTASAPSAPSRPVDASKKQAAHVAPPPPSSPVSTSARSSECSPPYVVTPEGKLLWKASCLSDGRLGR